jgi:anti-sigma factor RsiW
MKPCREFQQSLALHACGMLDGAARAALESHLSACPACRARLDALQDVCESLAAQKGEEVSPSPGFHARVERAILRRGEDRQPHWQWLGPVAAAACLALGLFFWSTHLPESAGNAVPVVAASAEETPPPTLLAYRAALSASDADLENLLQRQAAKILPNEGGINAFGFNRLLVDL